MLPIERRKEILNYITTNGTVKVSQLAKKYGVGIPTIRRDLKYLSEAHGIQLMYGGAYLAKEKKYESVQELDIRQKKLEHIEEKKIIAQKAAKLIQDGETIALNSGSTVELILDYIDPDKKINIVTLSLNVAAKAVQNPNLTVYFPGGKLRNISSAIIGTVANQFIRQFNIDRAFIGVLAVSIKKGVTHSSFDEIETNKTLAQVSDQCYLVADYSKYDKIALAKMFDLDFFDAIITDDRIPEIYRDFAQNNDIQVL